MDRFELFKSRLGVANTSRRLAEKRSAQTAARDANKNRHLSPAEAETLARRMHEMLEELEPELRSRQVSRTDICRKAFSEEQTSSRELYRVTLPPRADTGKRGLRMHLAPYRDVAIALEELTHRRTGQLVHRLVEGTACDDLRNANERWRDVDRLVAALDALVASLDLEFGWTQIYERTLRLRKQGLEAGDRLCWPLWDLDPTWLKPDDPDALEAYRRDLESETSGASAFYRPAAYYFWSNGRHAAAQYLDMGALQDTEFFFVPHAPVGHLVLWDLPPRRSDLPAYQQEVVRQLQSMRNDPQSLSLPSDDWDDANRRPVGQLDGSERPHLQYHVWLIAYPLPDLGDGGALRIGPALYQAGEDGGAWIMPLTSENLAAVSDAVWLDETNSATLVDRLTDLVTMDESDARSHCAGLRRTGSWLNHNPVLKAEEQRVHRQQALLRIASRSRRT